MCGICGFVGTGGEAALQRMSAALAHRGPDGAGRWSSEEKRVHLGHRRLSILDHAGGAQPMMSTDGERVIVFNGEIYNFAELRRELELAGRPFRSDHSDTEVLLQGYAHWGDDLLDRLNGMWAFVIYDQVRGRLFASRDRFGKKPFYYTTRGPGFAFASELSALLAHPDIQPHTRTSPVALRKYLAYGYIPAPLSYVEGVFKLPAGHNLSLELGDAGSLKIWRYWRYRAEPRVGLTRRDEAALIDEFQERFSRAVKRRLVADVPVGVFLSGGVDSSAVAASAASHLPPGTVTTFSVGFEEPTFDESSFAHAVADHLGTEHHREILSIEQARALLPEIGARLDEPMADSSLLPTYLLCRFARERVTVALGGDGSDELLGGYDPFRALRAAEAYQHWVPRPVHRGIAALVQRMPVSHRNMSLDFKLKRTLRGLELPPRLWLPTWMAPLAPTMISEALGEPIDTEELFSEAIDAWDACTSEDPVDRTIQFYLELYLQDDILTKVDRASMLHGLEVRSPFLDIELVDFLRTLPAEFKFRRGTSKYLLKQSLRGTLPSAILDRPKKGFGVPIGRWFKEGHLDLDPGATPFPSFARTALEAHRSGKEDHRAFLWAAWLLQARGTA